MSKEEQFFTSPDSGEKKEVVRTKDYRVDAAQELFGIVTDAAGPEDSIAFSRDAGFSSAVEDVRQKRFESALQGCSTILGKRVAEWAKSKPPFEQLKTICYKAKFLWRDLTKTQEEIYQALEEEVEKLEKGGAK